MEELRTSLVEFITLSLGFGGFQLLLFFSNNRGSSVVRVLVLWRAFFFVRLVFVPVSAGYALVRCSSPGTPGTDRRRSVHKSFFGALSILVRKIGEELCKRSGLNAGPCASAVCAPFDGLLIDADGGAHRSPPGDWI